ncbi:hypothetical protein MCOR25_006273 [Pyricularia grisea]|uniref:Zn(2)-C6 fungal-type domain-containing protein n=1 Tax=Pyricularia grisea TaxID=148305 RepID=A0A6P8BJZ8_PYRGI|nr:uncharacterized protein PgNI_01341 [Pyricularia grisea]KAI6362201.1 hypothetical protein MCOR25_006273 [Pyricularia grisea]TLD17226.1 hypothetical protein PgNI_01341 [Pyricularia grisea]
MDQQSTPPSDASTQANEAPRSKKPRPGARGVNKTRSGCRTCKKRHRKCDEQKPSCQNCIRAGWPCDFLSGPKDPEPKPAKARGKSKKKQQQQQTQDQTNTSSSALILPSRAPSSFIANLNADELVKLDLFANVAVKAMGISLNTPLLERIMLRAVQTEPCMLHAALSWSGLTRHVYWVGDRESRALSERQGFEHYNKSIQILRSMPRNRRTTELAMLASHIYASIDFNLGMMDRLVAHTHATLGMAQEMGIAMADGVDSSEDTDSIVRLTHKVHTAFAAQIQAWNDMSQGRDRGLVVALGEPEVGSLQRLALSHGDESDSTPSPRPGQAMVVELEDDDI